MTTVVSNAGPLIALAKLGRLGLLLRLYGSVMIPPAVYHEVVTEGLRLGAPDASAVQLLINQGHIVIVPVALPADSPLLAAGIDAGEAEAIALAQREEVDWVLIDGFRHSLLTLAEFGLLIETIRTDPTFWISERLCQQALRQVRREAGVN